MRAGLCLAALLIPSAAFAQSSSPGPYVLDVRGVMSGAPGGAFYPASAPNTIVPTRVFGVGGGMHVYLLRLGVARIGIGVDGARLRGNADTPAPTSRSSGSSSTSRAPAATVAAAVMDMNMVAGQISFNFGSREGWSYLTAGYGNTRTRGEVSSEVLGPIEHSVAIVKLHAPTVNFGGGARWFLRQHMAVGFDVRFHRLMPDAGPSKQIVGLSVGLSLR